MLAYGVSRGAGLSAGLRRRLRLRRTSSQPFNGGCSSMMTVCEPRKNGSSANDVKNKSWSFFRWVGRWVERRGRGRARENLRAAFGRSEQWRRRKNQKRPKLYDRRHFVRPPCRVRWCFRVTDDTPVCSSIFTDARRQPESPFSLQPYDYAYVVRLFLSGKRIKLFPLGHMRST